MTDEPDDPLADIFEGTEDAEKPEYEFPARFGLPAHGQLLPPEPKQENR